MQTTASLMTVREVSAETGLPESTLRLWRSQGTGPRSAKMGRRVVYRRSDVEAWIDAQFDEAEPTGTPAA